MKFLRILKEAVEMSDFFYSTKLLRFQKDGEYHTVTGGILSIGIIIIIIVGFANMIISTVNRTTITTSLKVEKKTSPTLTTLTSSAEKNFMFAIEVMGLNLSAPTRHFDVQAKLMSFSGPFIN